MSLEEAVRGFWAVKPLLIGQAPSRSGTDPRPLAGPAAERFADLLRIESEEFLARVDTVNLLDRWPGRRAGGKGDRFPMGEARVRADAIRLAAKTRVAVFVGADVATAFGAWELNDTPLVWAPVPWFERAAYLPHPSGVNLWYNDATNRERARRFLRALLSESPPSPR